MSSNKNSTVHLVSDIDQTGNQAYYFIRVEQKRLAEFLLATDSDSPIDLADFGEVLYSAYGDSPPPHIQNWARDEFGWKW